MTPPVDVALEPFVKTVLQKDLWWLDGLFTALGVAPVVVPPNRWTAAVTPPDGFESEAQARRVLGAMMERHNQVMEVVVAKRGVKVPAANDEAGHRWFAQGFVDGALMSPEWKGSVTHSEVLARFAGEAGRPELIPTRLVEHVRQNSGEAFRHAVPTLINAARAALVTPPSVPHVKPTAQKVGRNEPCPCGSGKKFKHCCGAVV